MKAPKKDAVKNVKKIVQNIFDSASFELCQNGRVKEANFGVVEEKAIPLKIDANQPPDIINYQINEQLNQINASNFVSLYVDFTGVIPSKIKKMRKVCNEPFLVAINRYKNGDADFLYAKLKKDFRGAVYVDPEETWVDKEKVRAVKELTELL